MSNADKTKATKKTPRKPKSTYKKLSVQEVFYSDIDIKNTLYAIIIRSPIAHGKITSCIHPKPIPGFMLYKAKDVIGKNKIQTTTGQVYLFNDENISYKGEPIGILVGTDERLLKDYQRELEFSFDQKTLDSYLSEDVSEEISPIPIKLAEREVHFGSIFEGKTKEEADLALETLFRDAPIVSQNSWVYAIPSSYYQEPEGAICDYKEDANTLIVYTPTQWSSDLRKIVSKALNIPAENIDIRKTTCYNYNTNSIRYNSIIAAQVALASKLSGRPVKLMYTREEQEAFIDCTRNITIVHKTALDEDGKILAMQIDIDYDAGAENHFAKEIIDRLVIASCGCYAPKNLSVHAAAYTSSNPPSSIDIDHIDAAAFFAVESQMSELCKIFNKKASTTDKQILTSIDIRNINIDYNTKGGRSPFAIDFAPLSKIYDFLNKSNSFERKFIAYHFDKDYESDSFLLNPTRTVPLRGIGIASAFSGSCYNGSDLFDPRSQNMEITVESESRLSVDYPISSGKTQEILKNIAKNILEKQNLSIAFENSQRDEKDFASIKESNAPENIYSDIGVMTLLFSKCCEDVKKKLSTQDFPFTVKKTLGTSSKRQWNKTSFTGRPFLNTSLATTSVEVEIDPCTFRESIRNITIIIYASKILDKRAATKSIRLTVQKLLSVLMENERLEYEKLDILFIDSGDTPIQINGLVYSTLPAAYTQAIAQAIDSSIHKVPTKTDSLYNALCEKRVLEEVKAKQALFEIEKEKQKEEESAEDDNIDKP